MTDDLIWDPELKKAVEPEVYFQKRRGRRHERIEEEWCPSYYRDQLAIAKSSRIAIIAVQAELNHLRFKSYDKGAPVELSNAVFKELGFSHSDKIRALKALEKAGWVKVQWRVRKSPLVVIIRKFA